mgnify:CR=1 FL=1
MANSLLPSRPQRVIRKSSALVTNTSLMPLKNKELTFHTHAELEHAALALVRLFLEPLTTPTKVSWMTIKWDKDLS